MRGLVYTCIINLEKSYVDLKFSRLLLVRQTLRKSDKLTHYLIGFLINGI